MRRAFFMAVLVGIVGGLAACHDGEGGGDISATVTQGPELPLDHPDLSRVESARDSRRISHLQLRRSVDALFKTKWTEDGFDLLFVLAPTLGDPDYDEITEENLDPSPLYVKFMEDLANAVCKDVPLATLQPKGTPAENVRALKLKLHGEFLEAGDPSLEPLIELERTAGIRAVCVALLGAPEFYLY